MSNGDSIILIGAHQYSNNSTLLVTSYLHDNHIIRKIGVELKLVFGFRMAKVKYIKRISIYLELHQTFAHFNHSHLKRQFMSIQPNITTASIKQNHTAR